MAAPRPQPDPNWARLGHTTDPDAHSTQGEQETIPTYVHRITTTRSKLHAILPGSISERLTASLVLGNLHARHEVIREVVTNQHQNSFPELGPLCDQLVASSRNAPSPSHNTPTIAASSVQPRAANGHHRHKPRDDPPDSVCPNCHGKDANGKPLTDAGFHWKRSCPQPQKAKPTRPGKPRATAAVSQHHHPTGSTHSDEHEIIGVSASILDLDFSSTHGCMAITHAGDPDVDMPQAPPPDPAPPALLPGILRHCFAPILNMVKQTLMDATISYPNLHHSPDPNGLALQFHAGPNVTAPRPPGTAEGP